MKLLFKAGKKNEVADALSRRTYPETSSQALEPEVIILSPDVQCFSPVTEGKSTQATFFYADYQRQFPRTIDVDTVHQVDTTSIDELQSSCPDFEALYNYFKNKELPEDKKSVKEHINADLIRQYHNTRTDRSGTQTQNKILLLLDPVFLIHSTSNPLFLLNPSHCVHCIKLC